MPKFHISYPKEINKNLYKKDFDNELGSAFYGLPKKVKFCRKCVISNQRPCTTIEFKNTGRSPKQTIDLSEDGICDACRVREIKDDINWKDREQELRDLCDQNRRNDGRYDCLVPGSGGKDSFMTAHLLKYKYGMNPLTCTWAPHIYTDWGWRNHQAWIHAGFDNILFTPNGKVHRLLTRLSTEKLFYPFQPFIVGQKTLAPKIAAQYDIDLIFYGENQAEYGNPKGDMKSSKMQSQFFSSAGEDEIYLSGYSLAELREFGLTPADWKQYLPIDSKVFESKKIQYYYLGYYEKWHPQGAYYYSTENSNFKAAPERTAGTYNTYNSIDDRVDDFHYHTTYIKFGIGRATYDASQEVRSGDITREEGISLIKKYDGEFPERWADEIFEYLSIPYKEFKEISNIFEEPNFDRKYYELLAANARSPHLWFLDEDNKWQLRNNIYDSNDLTQEETAQNWEGNF